VEVTRARAVKVSSDGYKTNLIQNTIRFLASNEKAISESPLRAKLIRSERLESRNLIF